MIPIFNTSLPRTSSCLFRYAQTTAAFQIKFSIISSLCVLAWLLACCGKKIASPAPEQIALDSTLAFPVSELHVPIYYPVKELENMINEKLQAKIIEAHLAISNNNDSLHLNISRFQPVRLKYDGDRGITYKIPVKIEGFVNSKVAGIRVRNKKAVRAKLIITMFSNLYLKDDWNLAPQTELRKIEWVEEPKLNVAGIKINLRGAIEKALNNNKDKLVAKLDESAGEITKIRQSIEKLWGDIQKPIRINRKAVPVWLQMDATDIDGRLSSRSEDTLMIEARLNARLHTVLDSAASLTKPRALPNLKRQVEHGQNLHAYALVTLPFELLNSVINQAVDTLSFDFGSRRVRIEACDLYGTPNGLAIGIELRGDLKANVFLKGTIGFDSLEKKIVIENFRFDLNSEESLLSAAAWLGHDVIIDRLRPYLSIPIENLFSRIPELINKGVEKGKLGKKMDLNFDELDVNFYSSLITTTDIQLVLSAKGKANIELQKGLFDKKKKPAKP
ncbi:MAG: DUF4403 family protein [Cyclobacteriaceae bacterium]|jgi:hypothetical protein|nr:DUF4403 family protein [Flammeovirgaceae bacterium]